MKLDRFLLFLGGVRVYAVCCCWCDVGIRQVYCFALGVLHLTCFHFFVDKLRLPVGERNPAVLDVEHVVHGDVVEASEHDFSGEERYGKRTLQQIKKCLVLFILFFFCILLTFNRIWSFNVLAFYKNKLFLTNFYPDVVRGPPQVEVY